VGEGMRKGAWALTKLKMRSGAEDKQERIVEIYQDVVIMVMYLG